MKSFLDEDLIEELLKKKASPSTKEVKALLDKARELKGLNLEEVSSLLNVEDKKTWELIFKSAKEVKEKVYGRRIVLFAPLYLSNYCTNNCLYCGFRIGNTRAKRRALTTAEAVKEASFLEKKGYKRLLLVIGEDFKIFGLNHLIDTINAIYRDTGIRILHLNAPPMEIEAMKAIKERGIGVYQLFQETYHRETYSIMHPSGRKSDYHYRLRAMDRALKAGFKDVGIGILLGLYDYRFDTLAAIAHSQYLYKTYGTHAHTISLPRLRPAPGAPLIRSPEPVLDEDLKRIVAICRLALPSVGIVISTRECKEMRDSLINIGVSQISAGSSTEPGGYLNGEEHSERQFDILDPRPLEEVMASIIKKGLMPSLCTSCYRKGRQGEVFTQITMNGEMGTICSLNSILTFKEYLLDYAQNGLKEDGERVIEEGIKEIKDERLKSELLKRLEEIEKGKRDVYY